VQPVRPSRPTRTMPISSLLSPAECCYLHASCRATPALLPPTRHGEGPTVDPPSIPFLYMATKRPPCPVKAIITMAFLPLSLLTGRGHPLRPTAPIKGSHPHQSSSHPSLPLSELECHHRRAPLSPLLHHHRPTTTPPPEPR
jgi:hypothetical protein